MTRIWIDGQFLQTAIRLSRAGRGVRHLVEAIARHGRDLQLHVSLNAALTEEAIQARVALEGVVAPDAIHLWHGLAEGGEATLGLTVARQASELALLHHVAILGPDVAVSADPFGGIDDCSVPFLPSPGRGLPCVAIVHEARMLGLDPAVLYSEAGKAAQLRRASILQKFDHILRIPVKAAGGPWDRLEGVETTWIPLPRRGCRRDDGPTEGDAEDLAGKAAAAISAIRAVRKAAQRPEWSDRRAAARAQTLPAAREMLTRRDFGFEATARLFALAEPPQPQNPGRLIIDVTQTLVHDAQSGIQRVVKRSCDTIIADRPASEAVLAFSTSGLWYEVHGSFRRRTIRRTPLTLTAATDDTVLMLDSSWSYREAHLRFLRAARLRGAKVIFCLYDLVPLTLPATCHPGIPEEFSAWLRGALEIATGFVCISRAVADEFFAMLEVIRHPRPLKIGYWQLGSDLVEEPSTRRRPHRDIRSEFLMVGTVEPRKGHITVLDAFEALWDASVEVTLTIVGRPGWGADHIIERILNHPALGKRLFWHANAGDELLADSYRNCDALIAASLGEGFGLPIVEARRFGKPVIASDLPVFREAAMGAPTVRFFKPESASALKVAVMEFVAGSYGLTVETPLQSWPSWEESGKGLLRVIAGGHWYRHYKPSSAEAFVPLAQIGEWRMTEPLGQSERCSKLQLVEGPIPAHGGEFERLRRRGRQYVNALLVEQRGQRRRFWYLSRGHPHQA